MTYNLSNVYMFINSTIFLVIYMYVYMYVYIYIYMYCNMLFPHGCDLWLKYMIRFDSSCLSKDCGKLGDLIECHEALETPSDSARVLQIGCLTL